MDAFSFAFSLFVVVLGLALTEVLGGMRNAMQSRRKVRIGWLLPLLGLIVSLEIISFWTVAWEFRGFMPAHAPALICGFVVTGLYYLVAGLVFPDDPAEWPDYDEYYFDHRRLVAGGIILCNLLTMSFVAALGGNFANWLSIISMGTTLGLWALLLVARSHAQNIAIMLGLALWNPVSALPTLAPHWFPSWLY
jgi:hypothetical protein